MNDKLMFVLCRMCGEGLNGGDCEHTSDERALVGTWTMDEVRKAVSKGYGRRMLRQRNIDSMKMMRIFQAYKIKPIRSRQSKVC